VNITHKCYIYEFVVEYSLKKINKCRKKNERARYYNGTIGKSKSVKRRAKALVTMHEAKKSKIVDENEKNHVNINFARRTTYR